MQTGKLEIHIKTLAGADWEKVQKCIEEIQKEYPDAEICVEWLV